ncbi:MULTISPECIES: polysialyltransferase family glycosyltransferase [unclassified Brevibacterium]|uniref:polysialyltransferase family glycosyltransferase n=1 Tax=unclassified Brevibacterium TaxID=2614124 RepID=UPI0010F84002|nr:MULTISPECIES: polysialyltransferase family glycosyltransferase [unclassified Brevibacterium]MCM1011611.1 alpha-2,8-polysialyltransferase family protein [Brevibacterium sp. XM4083]
MTQLIQVSTLYQLANVAANINAGHFGSADERRILVVANNAYAPEITPSAIDLLGSTTLLSRFDSVVDWNAAIWPSHPKQFGISPTRAPIMRTLLEHLWSLSPDEDISLVVESLPGHPAHALTQVFADAPISVHSDGLMSYGPVRNPLGRPLWQRLENVHYTDLLPGVMPRQLAEHAPNRIALTVDELRPVIEEMAQESDDALTSAGLSNPIDDSALVLGQYLAEIELITEEEEIQLHLDMLDEVKKRGVGTVIFKPHPTSARTVAEPLRRRAEALGLRFVLADVPVLAEVVASRTQPRLVVSCFSTGLVTTQALYGTETAVVGTELLLERIAPYQNSNRIPLTIVDALNRGGYVLEDRPGGRGLKDFNALIDAVTYCMQSTIMTHLREPAVRFLTAAVGTGDMVYFKRKRLTRLDLPGSLEASNRGRVLRTGKRILRKNAKSALSKLDRRGIKIDVAKLTGRR